MNKFKIYFFSVIILLSSFPVTSLADEGMWLPLYIKRLNYVDMQKAGLQLTPEEIYSVNQSSLKDAIVSLGGFCTGEMISSQGLMLTNHHCGFEVIQENSTVEHDYLTDGFWAMSKEEEIPAEGLTASFLVRMEDVTEEFSKQLDPEMRESERDKIIRELSDSISTAATEGTNYNARIKSFFEGNEFYLFIYETFQDVRLVGAPPSSIGKFGGDTDNWMWPRHTGDFTLFRVYCAPDGSSATYSKDNVPYEPKHHLPVSLEGVKKSDFAMIMGFPGSTDRFLTSYGVKWAIEKEHPARVKIREQKLAIMRSDMQSDPAVRIKYASKYAQVSNYYKYFKGQIKGLNRLNVYKKKKRIEENFSEWVAADPQREEEYGNALSLIKDGYETGSDYRFAQVYLGEAVFGSEIIKFGRNFSRIYSVLTSKANNETQLDKYINNLRAHTDQHFKDYNSATDRKVFAAMMRLYYNDIPEDFHPKTLTELVKKHDGNFEAMAEHVFDKSILNKKETVLEFLDKPKQRILKKDPAFQLMHEFIHLYRSGVASKLYPTREVIDKGNRLFVKGLREMNPDKKYYPNANSTLRLTYGQVLDYYPKDAVYYNYYTTLEGIMEKEDPNNDEFIVPEKLKQLYEEKDYGQYGEGDVMKVCFISNNDITGGNSGSPVINAKGHLIGCAFDGNWEAMSGDIAFEDELQRTISVDIRYVLFIIDKFAGASHLVEEMTLIKNEEKAQLQEETAPKEMN